jgi:tRNA A-37 threonylcarbamoyl transferase component Bud32/streptogramin lyase
MSVETDPLVGTDLAGHRLESLLGRGGMGVVYLATDLRLKRRVALKLIAPALAADPHFRERFLREAELAAALDHSHVVPVYGAGEAEGQLWLAMRYVEGTDLKRLLDRDGRLEPGRAIELCSQIGQALDAAHAHGLVHRDVKPANVLVTVEDGAEHCYLSDFGLARSGESSAAAADSARLSGTVDYTSPEHIAGGQSDRHSDLYSLACVLFECLSGVPPFRRDRQLATIFAHIDEPPPSLHTARPELPEAIDPVVARALAKAPDERYESCRELCDAAREALGLGARRFSRRTLLLAGGGALAAVTAAVAVPAILLSRRNEPVAVLEPKPPPALAADGVLRIDPATRRPVAAIPTELRADTLAIGDGAVWVLDTGTGKLARIDAASNRIDRRIEPEQPTRASTVAAGEGAVWLQSQYVEPSLWRLDLEAGTYLPYSEERFDGVTIGLGSVWAVNTLNEEPWAALVRLDPATGTQLDRVESAAWSYEDFIMATAGGLVWAVARASNVTHVGTHPVIAFDPQAGAIAAEFLIEFAIGDFAAGEDAVWVTALNTDTVARLDPTTGQVTQEVRVGRIPEQLTVGAGAVWATSARDGTITRVDPATSNIETIDVGGIPTDIAAGPDGVWVAVDVR